MRLASERRWKRNRLPVRRPIGVRLAASPLGRDFASKNMPPVCFSRKLLAYHSRVFLFGTMRLASERQWKRNRLQEGAGSLSAGHRHAGDSVARRENMVGVA